jgi:chorismate mutase-like protein
MNIADWRRRIDELDQKLVALLNERAAAAQAIGRLKRQTDMAIYEPDREKEIFQNIRRANRGPLPDRELIQLYERIIDVMRKIQRVQIDGGAQSAAPSRPTEIEAESEE